MIGRAGLALAALLAAAPAMGQAYQCRLPDRVGPLGDVRPDGPMRRTAIAGYTLAASWSPEYCKMSGDADSLQCSGRLGRFGFILHGLWPEAKSGAPPQWCAPAPRPRENVVRSNLCMTPSASLIAHEWAKHGSCMVQTPDAYMRVSAILWRSLRWPDADRLSRGRALTAGDFRKAFVAANRDWRPRQIGLMVSRGGWLREVHLCYGANFMPADCDARRFGPGDAARLKIWRGL